MTRTLRTLCLVGASALLASLGCTGAIGSNGSSPGGGGPGTNPPGTGNTGTSPGPGTGTGPGMVPNTTGPAAQPGAGALSDKDSVPGPAPVRRLTRLEYDNTLRDLLGVTESISSTSQFGNDADSSNAGFVRGGSITGGDDARNLLSAGAKVTELVMPKLASLLPCKPLPTAAGEQEACANKFIADFGQRAYRRPLSPREIELGQTLYKVQRSAEVGASFQEAMGALIAGFIQAPQFLYHWELGPSAPIKDGNLVRYNSYEVASRLSYLLWASMPDDQLFAAAAADALRTPEQIAQQARRLLADARAKDALADFHLQWLEIGPLTATPKDETVTGFSPAIAQSMLNETREFAASLFTSSATTTAGTLEALLTSTSTVGDAAVAKIYGAQAPTGPGAQVIQLNPEQRAGVLTQLSFLTAHADSGDSHPVKRGDAFLRRLLCMELEVPANIEVPPVAEPNATQSTRERFEVHSAAACATACHQYLDPIGFAFESYDTIGSYRSMDRNKPVNTAGQLVLPSGAALNFKNAVDLVTQVSKLPEVQQCMTTQWMRYMMGRREVQGEQASLDVVRDLFAKSNNDLRELLVGLTRSRSFTHRSLSAGEVAQ